MHCLFEDVQLITVCSVVSGSAGGAESGGAMSASVDEADADGVRWCSRVCSSSSGDTRLTKLKVWLLNKWFFSLTIVRITAVVNWNLYVYYS